MNTSITSMGKRTPWLSWILLLIINIGMMSWANGQTNPAAHNLSSSDFSFTGFALGTTTTYPTSMQGHKFPAERSTATLTANADGDRVLAVSTDPIGTGSIRNEVANGISLLNSGSNNIGAIVISVNSTGRSNLTVSWTAQQLSSGGSGGTDRINGLRLQYRIGTTGSFTDVSSTEYLTTNTASQNAAQTFSSIALPSACNNEPVVHVRWVYYISSGTANGRDRIRLDDLSVSSTPAAGPTLTWAPTSFTGFTSTAPAAGTPYSSATIEGASLTGAPGNITITAPTNFEVFNGTLWVSSYAIPYASATLTATTVQMRIAAGVAAGPVSGNFTAAGGGATTVNFAGSGTVVGPVLTVTATMNKFHANESLQSDAQEFTVTGSSLSASTTITAPANFEVSTTSATAGFGTTATIATTPSYTNIPVWVRISSSAPVGIYTAANVTVASALATTQNVSVNGQKYANAVAVNPNNILALRIGDGTLALSGAAQPVFFDEITPAGVVAQTIAMPMANVGANRRFTLSGTATTDGVINLSPDRKFLTITGYNAPLYSPAVTSSSIGTVQRLVALVDFNGTVNTTTRLNAYDLQGIRGGVTVDGTGFWTSGPTTGSGLRSICYVPFGNDGTGVVQINTTSNSRSIAVSNSNLIISTASTIGQINGLPTGTSPAPTSIITGLADAYNFVFLDLDAGVAGNDVVYIADNTGGLKKFSFDGTTWTARGVLTGTTTTVTARFTGTNVEIFTHVGTGAANTVYRVVDNAAFNAPITGNATAITAAGTLIRTTAANTVYRSVAFTPIDVPTPEVTHSFATPTGTFAQGENNRGLYRVQLANAVADAILTSATFTVGGSFSATDVSNYRLFFSTDAILDGGDPQIGLSITTISGPGQSLVFSGLGQNIPVGTSRYLFVTASLSGCATVGSTINITSTPLANFIYADADKFGTPVAGTNRTITAGTPSNVTSLTATSGIPTVPISWVNPSCYDAILVVVNAGSPVTANPATSTYSFNNTFAFAPAFPGGGKVVFYSNNPSASNFNMLGTVAGTTYHIKTFVRIGTVWSSGVEVTATPQNLTLFTVADGIGYQTSSPFSGAIWSTSPTGPGQTINTIFGTNLNQLALEAYAIVIRHNVQWQASGARCRSIQVDAGAKIFRNSNLPGDNVYIRVYGTDIIINGEWGNGAGVNDQLSLEIEGITTTISGNAPLNLVNISRIRKQQNTNPTSTLTIARSINLTFAGTAFFNNISGTSLNLTINSGRTVNVVNPLGNVSIDGDNGAGTGNIGGTITINGILNVGNTTFLGTSNNTDVSPQTINLVMGTLGVLNTKNLIFNSSPISSIGTNVTYTGGAANNSKINVSERMVVQSGDFPSNGKVTILNGGSLIHGDGTPIPTGFSLGALPLTCTSTSNVSGNITVKKAGSSNLAFYNYWSTPVTGAGFNSIRGFLNISTSNLYQYDPTLPTANVLPQLLAGWVQPNTALPMTVGRGYINTNAANASFTGTANNGPYNVPVVVGAYADFNLIGNPYPQGLSADAFIFTNHSSGTGTMINAVYFWTNPSSTPYSTTGADYVVYGPAIGIVGGVNNPGAVAAFNVNKIIPSCQSFFTRAINGGGNVTFNNSMRRDGTGSVFFEMPSDLQRIWIGARNMNGADNEILLGFTSSATEQVDDLFEAEKFDGNNELSFYTKIADKRYVIEALPSLTNKRIIPLGFNANQIGEHTIKLNKVDQLDETSLIVLEDRLLGVFHNLRASNYVFNTTEAIEGLGRFYLHVSAPIKLETQAPTCENAVGSLTIDVPSTDVWNASLLNQNGVMLSNFVAESNYTINDLTSGNYTLSLTNTFGETFNKSFEIDGIETVAVNLTVNQNSAFINENLIFEANAENANHFEFNFGNGDVVNSNEPVVFYSYPTAGNYEVTVKAFSYDCEATSTQTVEVLNTALSVQTVDQTKLVVMPNPANDVVTIVLPSVTAQATLILLDAKGSVVLKEVMNNQASTTISTQNLANGIYQIQLITNKQNIQSKLVVVH